MAEWFKAAVLTRRQEAEANIDEVDGPKGEGQDARSKTAVVTRIARLRQDNQFMERWPSGLRQQS